MSAQLELRNIGGFKGTKVFEFQKGVVNQVEAPNAMGKTTIMRGLAAVLSMPLHHDELIKEGMNQGVLRDSLKNIYEKDAAVRLTYDGHDEEWEMRSDGTFSQLAKGDQRFLLAGVLTQEARTIRQLVQGEADFSWVTGLLSYAQRYAVCKALVDSKLAGAESQIDAIRKRQEGLADQERRLQDKKEKREMIEKQRDEFARRLDETKRQHIERLKALDKQLDVKKQQIAQHEANIDRTQQEIQWLQARLESNARNSMEIEKQLQEIDLASIRREVGEKVSQADKEIGRLRAQAAILSGKKSTFVDAKAVLGQGGEDEGPCPVCEVSLVKLSFLDDKISELTNEMRKIDRQIQVWSSERSRWLQQEATARQQIDKLNQSMIGLKDEQRDLTARKDREERALKDAEELLVRLQNEETDIGQERAKLEKQTEEWATEIHEALKDLEKQLQVIGGEIADHTRRIRESSLEDVQGRRMVSARAQLMWRQYKDKLDGLREYLDERQHEHELKAIADFNNNVRVVMADLGFTEFDQIALDRDDTRLQVFRSGFVRQPIESLSTAERDGIAIVLQIALKNTYLPDIPFLIVDEVVVSYDEERKRRLLDYLRQLALERDLYVIVTCLSEKAEGEVVVKVR